MENSELRRIRKEFSIYDFEVEEAFLQEMSQTGWFFRKYEGENYYFEKRDDAPREYLIDFYLEALDESSVQKYNEDGFILDFTYISSKDGVWYYFSRPTGDYPAKVHQREGRLFLLNRVKNRIERFGLVIMAVALVFFGYLYIKYQDIVLLIAVVVIAFFSLYLFMVYRNIKQRIGEIDVKD